MFLGDACCPDVALHSPTEGSESQRRCYATSLSTVTCELKYDESFVTSVYFSKHENTCFSKYLNL